MLYVPHCVLRTHEIPQVKKPKLSYETLLRSGHSVLPLQDHLEVLLTRTRLLNGYLDLGRNYHCAGHYSIRHGIGVFDFNHPQHALLHLLVQQTIA